MQGTFLKMNQGKFNAVSAFFLLLLLGILFVAFVMLPKWMDNYSLKHEMYRLMVNASQLTDQQIVNETVKFALGENIPLAMSEITCFRQANQITCKYQYNWPVEIGGKKLFDMKLAAEQSREISVVYKKLVKP